MSLRPALRSPDPTITIVVPARNDATSLERILPELPRVHQVILVDGDSVDGTVETARRVLPGITVVPQTRRGLGNALACGFEAATGDVIVVFAADGSTDPSEIPAFVEALVNGADVARGSRFRRGVGVGSEGRTVLRSTGNLGLNVLCNVLLGTKYSDLGYGYSAFWREILPAFDLLPSTVPAPVGGGTLWGDGFEIETVLTCRMAAAKLRVTEVPSVEKKRIDGGSNPSSIGEGLRVLKTILDEKRRDASAIRSIREESDHRPIVSVTGPIRIDAGREVA
jgi:glycosyltransferase involved in cell wall biosynthesis